MRAVSVPFSPARPSRLKNEPGIFPAAYMRSSTSTVRGRKSASRRDPAVAVARTIVSPWRTTTAPPACLAIRPVSNEISLPAISTESRVIALLLMFCLPVRRSVGGACWSFPQSRIYECYPVSRLISSGVGRSGQQRAAVPERRRHRDAGAHAAARLLAHQRGDLLGAAVALEAVEVEAERRARAPTGAGRRCARDPRRARRGTPRSAPGAPAASAAQASGTARGCLAAIAKWRKAIRSGASRSRACASAQRGQVKSRVDDHERPVRVAADVVTVPRRAAAAGRCAGRSRAAQATRPARLYRLTTCRSIDIFIAIRMEFRPPSATSRSPR